MSGIVIELQEEALDSNSDIVSLLRKAYLIARKLNLTDFEKWINNELNGYQDQNEIPEYRSVYGEVKGWNPYQGWIPVVVDNNEMSNTLNHRMVTDSAAKLKSLLSGKGNYVTLPISGGANAMLSEWTGFETKYLFFFGINTLSDILEKVKNSILDWSITLEENGIMGEGLKFTNEEKSIAKTNTTINNYYTNNFAGEVSNSQIQQGSKKSKQSKNWLSNILPR